MGGLLNIGQPARHGAPAWRLSAGANVYSNLDVCGMRHLADVVIADSSRAAWRSGPLFDAIVTDRTCGDGARQHGRVIGVRAEDANTRTFAPSHWVGGHRR